MGIAQQVRVETARRDISGHDVTILLGYSFFVVLLLIGIYWGSMSSGTAPGDFATMIVFP